MTPLQAFQQAQETGQIAITKNTAGFFANYLQMEKYYNKAVESLTADYTDKDSDNIAMELHEPYRDLCEALFKQFFYNVTVESLGWNEFQGL